QRRHLDAGRGARGAADGYDHVALGTVPVAAGLPARRTGGAGDDLLVGAVPVADPWHDLGDPKALQRSVATGAFRGDHYLGIFAHARQCRLGLPPARTDLRHPVHLRLVWPVPATRRASAHRRQPLARRRAQGSTDRNGDMTLLVMTPNPTSAASTRFRLEQF